MERRSRATTGTTQKENGARSDGAKRRSVGRQTMARTGEPRRSKRAQRDAKPGAKRRSEPGWARVFLLLMSCGYSKSPQKHHIHKASHSVGLHSVAIAPSLRARILGGGAYRWFRRCATPPPATVFRPYRGFKFRSLRSPTSYLSSCLKSPPKKIKPSKAFGTAMSGI